MIGAELRQTTTQGSTSVLLNVGTFTPNAAGGRVNEIRFNAADVGQAISPLGANGYNIPSLLSVHETAPYFYSGLAQTLQQVLDGSQDATGGVRHHFVTDPGMRAELIAFLRSIGPIGFTDNPLTPGAVVKAVHITELRVRIDQLRARFGLGAFAWTDLSLVAGTTVILRQHVIDLRTALEDVYVAAARMPPTYTDSGLAPGTTIKAAHVAELRAAVVAIE